MKMLATQSVATLKTRTLPTLDRQGASAARAKHGYGSRSYYAQRLRVWKRDPHCAGCGVLVPYEHADIDHITPIIDGGGTEDSNMQVLCRPCHKEKTRFEAKQRAAGVRNI